MDANVGSEGGGARMVRTSARRPPGAPAAHAATLVEAAEAILSDS
jgi:hypothetical protein